MDFLLPQTGTSKLSVEFSGHFHKATIIEKAREKKPRNLLIMLLLLSGEHTDTMVQFTLYKPVQSRTALLWAVSDPEYTQRSDAQENTLQNQ